MTTSSKILVANLGSTSFKYRLFDMPDGHQLARGGAECIGAAESRCDVQIGDHRASRPQHLPDHAAAVRQCLDQLTDPEHGCLKTPADVSAIGFKTVHGGQISGVQFVTPKLLAAMEEMCQVAPAHNPPYIEAMRLLSEKLPDIPLVAAFETTFHATIPERLRTYAIPRQWVDEFHIRKWGFHGASHRYIAERTAELIGRTDVRIISCHLGGSSSLCAIRNGQSVATSMGMSPQSGVPQNNRVGDLDPFTLPLIMQRTGKPLNEVLQILAEEGGLLGLSGVSGDIRDLENAATEGNRQARLALDVYTTEVRRHLGGLLVELGGTDVLVFTGGIGENRTSARAAICQNLDELGIKLETQANETVRGESEIGAADSRSRIWVIPTNEELIVARQAYQLLQG